MEHRIVGARMKLINYNKYEE